MDALPGDPNAKQQPHLKRAEPAAGAATTGSALFLRFGGKKGTGTMPKYFMQNTHLAGLEAVMMTPPRFTPRRSGMMLLDRHCYTREDADCRLCTKWRRRRCDADRCAWIAERLEAGAVSFGELLDDCFGKLANRRFQHRLHAMTAGHDGGLYHSGDHLARFESVSNCLRLNLNSVPAKYIAALFLLTSSQELWNLAKKAVTADGIRFGDVRLSGLSASSYAVYQAAKSIFSGNLSVRPSELADQGLVNDSAFRLIVGGVLIARFGRAALNARWKDGAVC